MKISFYIASLYLLFTSSCLSCPLKVCVHSQNDTLSIGLCEDNLIIESITVYHLDSETKKYKTDWKIRLINNEAGVRSVIIGILPEGYVMSKGFNQLEEGNYIIGIDTNRERGEIIVNLDHNRRMGIIYDSVESCPDNICNPMNN